MATIEDIGTAAGTVWHFLRSGGPATLYAIERGVALPKPLVAMALGWLARENKLLVEEGERTTRYDVRE